MNFIANVIIYINRLRALAREMEICMNEAAKEIHSAVTVRIKRV